MSVAILAPCASADEVEPLVRAGAGELYCGVYDEAWARRWGLGAWPNRRGPGPGNLGSLDELRALGAAAGGEGVPVYLTLNAPYYAPEQEDAVVRLAHEAAAGGWVAGLVIGDPGVLARLRAEGVAARLVASTLCTARNAEAVRFLAECGAARVILSRELSVAEIVALRGAVPGTELEVFVLGDACAFEEGSCATAHTLPDHGVYCMTPWRCRGADPAVEHAVEQHRLRLASLAPRGYGPRSGLPLGPCGLCALPELAAAGIDSVKIVGREAHPYRKVRSVQMVRHVLDGLDEGGADEARRRALALRDDPGGCRAGLSCSFPELRPR